MTLLAILVAAALGLALMALLALRRVNRRIDRLQQSYWDLRYEHGRLRAQLKRLDPEDPEREEPEAPSSTTFIPLSSLKR